MSGIDEAMLIALVDGELDEVTRRRVERAVQDDPALARRLAMHHAVRDRLARHYAPIAREPVPDHLRRMVEDHGGIVPIGSALYGRSGWRRHGGVMVGAAIAASLMLGVGIGHITGRTDSPIMMRDGAMVANGSLATALTTQLASAQDGEPVQIGVTFVRRGGGLCRSFNGAVAGVACRAGDTWRVEQAVPGSVQTTQYRQAASGDGRVLATVQTLIDGAPLDAAAEQAARDKGWRR